MKLHPLWLNVLILMLTACSTAVDSPKISTTPENTEQAVELPSVEDVEEEAVSTQGSEADTVPIEVSYLTPSQGEGPFYTLEKPADRDNDLTAVAGAAGSPEGNILEFSGKVYNADGWPIEGAFIEIWQTDNRGIYLHPGDSGTANRDRNFQFYGEAVTSADGSYWFRTILPGRYEPRPVHIHFKVRIDDREVLTSQFYFEGDPNLEIDGLSSSVGSDLQHLIIALSEGIDADGESIFQGERDIILNIR